MPAAVQSLPLDTVKMDDRKRGAPDEHTRPTSKVKRQAVSVNGAPGRSEDDFPKDEDLDVSIVYTINLRSRNTLQVTGLTRSIAALPKGRHPPPDARIQARKGQP